MPFDLATAKPVGSGGFDISTARPVHGDEKYIPGSEGAIKQDAPPTSAVDFMRGLPGAALSAASSVPAEIAGRATALVNPEAGRKVTEAMTYQPSERGQETLRLLGKGLEKTGLDKLSGLGPAFAPELAATPAVPAVKAAANAPKLEIEAAKRIPGKIADVVTPRPSPEIAALAKKAEGMGIELRPDMLSNNRIAKMMGEALEQVPLSGSKAEQRQIAFNSALTKIIGGDDRAKRLTPDVFDRAMNDAGEKIGEISRDTPIALPGKFSSALEQRAKTVSQFETADTSRIVRNRIQQLVDAAQEGGGIIQGEKFRKINSEISQQARNTSQGDLKHALGELLDDMHDALESQIKSPEKLAELKDARFKYAMGKIIEPLVAKAKGGDISPSGLMAAVTSDKAKKTLMARGRGGEIGDLARIGQAFLKEPPSSGTGERLGAYSLLTGGVVAEPHTAAGIVSAANLYNRLGPKLTKRALQVRDVDPQATQPWNIGLP